MNDDNYSDAIAVKIASSVLREQGSLFDEPLPELWLVFSPDFIPHDSLPCYYPDEIPILATKTPEQLREIHRLKLTMPGSRVKA